MKKKLFNCFGRMTAVVMALMLMPLTAWADVEINEANFPDPNFRAWLMEQEYGQDVVLTDDEIKGITFIDVSESSIKTLEGIEVFTALQTLYCYINQLTALDVSSNTALQSLGCGINQLTTLSVSGCTALEALDCYNNKLTKLDVSGCAALQTLECSGNKLTKLDVSGCAALQTLECSGNKLTKLDVSGCTALQELRCSNNQLTSLDVLANTALQTLSCDYNQLTTLDVSANTALQTLSCSMNQLTSLDVLGCTALQDLRCHGNQLTSLDVLANTALQTLSCDYNQLTSLDVLANTALQTLSCDVNQLTALDVSANTALQTLYCSMNQLTALDVSANTALQILTCDVNQLTALDVSGCTALQILSCDVNQLKGEGMDAFIGSLPEVESADLIVYNTRYGDGNVCTKKNVADARAKGWTVYYHNDNDWEKEEYEGVEVDDTDNERYMLHKVEIEGVEYSLYKQVVNGNDVRRDPDGKESYRSKLSLDVKRDGQTATYDIDDELYFSAGLDYRSDIQPMQFDMDKREIFIFTQSATATNNRDYTYDGFAYVTSMDEISFNKESVFKNINQGFFSRFIDIRNNRVALAHYKYSSARQPQISIRSAKGNWTTMDCDGVGSDSNYAVVWNRMGENVLLKGEGYSELNDELYQAAMDAIKASPSTRYYIYTIYDTPEGPKKYYLTKEGKLVEWAKVKANDRFYFTKATGSFLYATPGLVMNIRFSNPKPDNGGATGNIVPQGHLLVETNYKRNDWEGQVWFKKGDCFAVRATNALSLMWGADTYWCTLDSNGDGEPEADYGLTPSFVWYLENPNADSIDDLENESDQADAPIYDLSGRRLQGQPVQKGIYLRNGKKILYK